MRKFVVRLGLAVLALVGLLAASLVVLVVLLENGTFNGFIERQASQALGREVRLDGPPDVLIGWAPGLAVGPVSVGNPSWLDRPGPMASVRRAEATVRLSSLLRGEIVIPRVIIDTPRADLVRAADGRANWEFPSGPEPAPDEADAGPLRLPKVEVLEVRNGAGSLDDAVTQRQLRATLEAQMRPQGDRSALVADLGVQGAGDQAPAADAHLEGWIADPTAPHERLELTLTSQGERAADLMTLVGVEVPGELPGYDVKVAVGRDAEAWRLLDLDASLGDTTIKGSGQVIDPTNLAGLQLTVDGAVPEPGDLLAAFGLGDRPIPGLEMNVRASRDAEVNRVTADGRLGGDDLDLELTTEGPIGELRGLKVTATAGGDQLGRLLPLLGLTQKPVPTYALNATVARDGEGAATVDATASLGNTRLSADGRIGDIETFRAIDLTVAVAGPDPADLLDTFGLPPISLPPYDIRGRLQREEDVFRVVGLDGRFGESDIEGDLAADLGQDPVAITGDLASDRLEFDDLSGLIGLPSASADDPGVTAEQQQEAEDYAADDRLLPDVPIDSDAWRGLDLDVRYQGRTVNAPNLPIENLNAHIVTRDGWLTLDPFQADIAGGNLRANVSLDGSRTPSAGDFDIEVSNLRLNEFMKRFGFEDEALGTLDGRAQLQATGGSVRDLAATADGRIALTMQGGSINRIIPEAGGLDIAQGLGNYIRSLNQADGPRVPIRCFIADFVVEDGVMQARTVLFDTPEDKLTLDGTIDLGEEQLDLMFHAYPRDASIGSSRMPISIEGPIKSPTISPAPGYVENRTLGWVLSPLAAVFPFVELGMEDDHPCRGVVDRVEEQTQRPE